MCKKFLFWIIWILFFLFSMGTSFAQSWWPWVVCYGLPGCNATSTGMVDRSNQWEKEVFSLLWNVISEWIQYVAVIAVLSLIISGIMFVLAAGEEEKITKARKWIIWSLVWVLLSISAWSIINLLNTFKI